MHSSRLFVEPRWRTWFNDGCSINPGDVDQMHRAHEIWGHANQLLPNADSEFVRSDIVGALKRSVDHRLRLFKDLYGLRQMAKLVRWGRDVDDFEAMAKLGLIRPLMLRKLVDIRNAVEHEDKPPPNEMDCGELVELAWYFLRSTDSLVLRVIDEYVYVLLDEEHQKRNPHSFGKYHVELLIHTDTRVPKIEAFVPLAMTSDEAQPGWVEVSVSKKEVDEESVRLDGEIRGPRDVLIDEWRHYFERHLET